MTQPETIRRAIERTDARIRDLEKLVGRPELKGRRGIITQEDVDEERRIAQKLREALRAS